MKTLHAMIVGLALVCLTSATETMAAVKTGTLSVTTRPYAVRYKAYAQVEPRAILIIRATTTGEIHTLLVSPGMHVAAQQQLATLAGPEYEANLATAEAHYRAAQAVLKAVRHNFPQFSSAQDLATAQASLAASQAALQQIQAGGIIRAPVAGIVQSVALSSGSRVAPGVRLLQLLPDNSLWVRATMYGRAALDVRQGMTGVFHSNSPAVHVAVRVQGIALPLSIGGGAAVICVARNRHPGWQDGETGTLEITAAPSRPVPVVPNSALVMDQGSWWVLVSDTRGLHRTQVEIGPSSGEWTFVLHGLRAGERVVAVNAYLLFHADIDKHYTPPD
ncbi:MAG: efflux RND transporter periplasmic adaptor subunit [Gammaproteobacteria bacterium]|nr:efflux RND transporter periplasmic adaptor subunit [Gammaproteobacteria bacterium]MDE2346798.1 efflux RND transporter periplasmic adaptor subunit [Gammaproteobacteria bacterium]